MHLQDLMPEDARADVDFMRSVQDVSGTLASGRSSWHRWDLMQAQCTEPQPRQAAEWERGGGAPHPAAKSGAAASR